MQTRLPSPPRRPPARVRAEGAAHAGNGIESKASRAALVALFAEGRPRWTPRDYAALAREGFAKNPVAYRAVRMIAEAVASIPLVLFQGARELDEHALLTLLARPNP